MSDLVLEGRGLTRAFGHVKALTDVNFGVRAGEILALIGDNGAGKSTLVSALSGSLALDHGEILVQGRKVDLQAPSDASHAGIETVYQDLALAPDLGAAQNIFLGREVRRAGLAGALGMMDDRQMRARSRAALDELGSTVQSLSEPVGAMSGGQRQAIAIARAVAWANKVVFLDEPTAALGVRQTANVLDAIRRVRDKGVAVVLITHSMPHVMQVADRVTIMRLGRIVTTVPTTKTSMEQLVAYMTGALTEGAAA